MNTLTKQQLLNNIKLISSEIQDFNDAREDDDCRLGSVQIYVSFEFNNKEFHAQLQTSNTQDVGQISSRLDACAYIPSEISEYCEENFEDIIEGDEVIHVLLQKFGMQEKFNDYIKKYYDRDEDMPKNCMDANSETNEMTRKA